MGNDYTRHISVNDPAFSAEREQQLAEARDNLLNADEFVLITVKYEEDNRSTKPVFLSSIRDRNVTLWVRTLFNALENVIASSE